MTPKEQAARQALEALEYLPEMRGIDEAITALREALAVSEQRTEEQAEQEPVAYLPKELLTRVADCGWDKPQEGSTPLYTAPVRTKDLTDECNLLKDHLSDAKEIIQKLMKERDALVANNKPSAFSVARKRLAKLDQHVRT